MSLPAAIERLGLSGELVRLEGGYENDVYRVGEHVVRVAAPWIGMDRVSAEHALMTSLEIPEIATPTHEPFELDGRVISIFPFREGTQPEDEDDATHLAGARLLARIHASRFEGPLVLPSTSEMDWDRNPSWDIDRVREALLELGPTPLDDLETHRVELRAEVHTMRELETGVIHGDYWPGNLLVADGRITAVIDWIDTRHDWLAFELGRAIWEFCDEDDELDVDFAHQWLEAYVDAEGPVPPDEFDTLVTMMRVSVLSDALRDLTYEGPTEDVLDYHVGSIRRLEHLAQVRFP